MPEKTGEENHFQAVNKKDDIAEDRALIGAAQAGDKQAYGRMILKYQKRLFRLVFMMLGQFDNTEDIVQDAFVKGYLALESFDRDKPFYPWISSIARNLAINLIKKNARSSPLSEHDDKVMEVPDKGNDPLDRLVTGETDRHFARAVAALPEQFRSVFVLRMFEDMSYEEIAAELGISEGTVDSRLHRARQKLVEMLKEYL
jgi:RNA polymerase sigma-70 factor (ECF subfamily)